MTQQIDLQKAHKQIMAAMKTRRAGTLGYTPQASTHDRVALQVLPVQVLAATAVSPDGLERNVEFWLLDVEGNILPGDSLGDTIEDVAIAAFIGVCEGCGQECYKSELREDPDKPGTQGCPHCLADTATTCPQPQ